MSRHVRFAVHSLTVVVLLIYAASCVWRLGSYTTTRGRAIQHGALIYSRWPVWIVLPKSGLVFDIGFQWRPRWDLSQQHAGGVVIPLWTAALPMAAVSAWLTTTRRRRLNRRRCPVCNYDVSATPDRCPECGTIVPRGLRATRISPKT